MQVFLGWWQPCRSKHDLELIRDAGFTWVKQVFAWRDIEGAAKGHLAWQRPEWKAQYNDETWRESIRAATAAMINDLRTNG